MAHGPRPTARKTVNGRVIGTTRDYGDARKHFPKARGRFLNPHDEEEKRRVVFLGNEMAKDIFGEEDPVGKTVLINNSPSPSSASCRASASPRPTAARTPSTPCIPQADVQGGPRDRPLNVVVFRVKKADGHGRGAACTSTRCSGPRLGFDPEDPHVCGLWNTVEGQKMSAKILIGLEIFFGIIGALTLIIGGVGVANIMYAVVKERTKEIGVKMALGARSAWITGPFVLEGLVYTFVGGLFGALIAIVIVTGLGFCRSRATTCSSSWATRRSRGRSAWRRSPSSGICGLLAGYFPARRAAVHRSGLDASLRVR